MKNKVSIWLGKFDNEVIFKRFTEIKYTDDGDSIPSQFEEQLELGYYDRDLVEMKFLKNGTSDLYELLEGFSYFESFEIVNKEVGKIYNSVILIYDYDRDINEMKYDITIDYLGQFDYEKKIDDRW
ncbi:MAG: immunity 22 family protein [Erysipelotrichaceae bacterium]